MKPGAARLVYGVAALVAVILAGTLLGRAPPPAAVPLAFAPSIAGTAPDGRIRESGEALVVDAELKRLFEYYLAAIGEQPLPAIQSEIEKNIARQLGPRAARQASDLLRRFIEFKVEQVNIGSDLRAKGAGMAADRMRLLAMQDARLRFFSAREAQGLFGEDDADDFDSLARLEVVQDKGLDPAAKRRQLAAIDAAMPASLRRQREAPLQLTRLEDAVQSLRLGGGGLLAVYQLRAKTRCPAAASRLAELDREGATWQARIDAYLTHREALGALTSGQQAAARATALQQLRQSHFNELEQKRLPAFEPEIF